MSKRRNKEVGERLGEAVLELVLTVVLFAVGALVLLLFGICPDSERIDGDTVVLLGGGAVAVLGFAAAAVYGLARKHKKHKKTK